uniref:Platelet-activating factor acetylhydrolase IB subunit alpha1 n=2 Tax=Suricata suricatta TaxID=37032 RepID=A0A673VFZ6_SURSU
MVSYGRGRARAHTHTHTHTHPHTAGDPFRTFLALQQMGSPPTRKGSRFSPPTAGLSGSRVRWPPPPERRSSGAKMSGEENPASKPTPVQDVQGDGRWMSLHHRFVADSKDKEPEVVFIGDSLVQLMHQCEIWRELFSPLHALNFGIGSDSTQHVLWRLENGELEHIRPKIVVVWVGTNNHGHTAEQVTGGIKAIVQLVNQRQPQARVVVLGLLPRGQHPNPLREKNRRVNELVRAALAGHPRAHFLDADPGFVHSDGTISHHDMYDYLHLSRLGYTPVCRALHSLLLRLLAQDQGQGGSRPEATP